MLITGIAGAGALVDEVARWRCSGDAVEMQRRFAGERRGAAEAEGAARAPAPRAVLGPALRAGGGAADFARVGAVGGAASPQRVGAAGAED